MNSTPMLQDSAFVFAIHATPKNPNPTQFSPLRQPVGAPPQKIGKGAISGQPWSPPKLGPCSLLF